MSRIILCSGRILISSDQAGVVLEKLDTVLAEEGLMVPLDLGAKVSACPSFLTWPSQHRDFSTCASIPTPSTLSSMSFLPLPSLPS